ncbi:MAG: hypothetical protein RBR86_00440 [Pseudobdellovibrionaceae bacterium]|jgi:methyl-accepting chemotaxis protein|nr:hypothetical protein [Pseudobdellovibrionaceae bacterium]
MTLIAKKEQDLSVQGISVPETDLSAQSPIVGSHIYAGSQPVLKNWKISARHADQDDLPTVQTEPDAEADAQLEEPQALTGGDEPTGGAPTLRSLTDRNIRTSGPSAPYWLQISQAVAVFLTVSWITYAGIYILSIPGSIKSITTSPLAMGLVLACVMTPVAMLWLCISAWQRRSDAHIYAQALKQELRDMLFPSEEQSRLISDDIHLLMKQASEMSASSRAAVKAIQRARAGLRTEIRDFSGVTQKAEFHIDRLADSLGKRAEELLSMTETIEAQADLITQKSQRGLQSWENVSAEISELGEEIDDLFNKGSAKIISASEAAGDKVANIETGLANAAEKFSVRIGEVAVQIENTQGKIEDDTTRLGEMAITIASGAERLGETLKGAERISESVQGVMGVMSGSLDKVEETSRKLFERTDEIEHKLSEKAQNLEKSADKLLASTNEIQQVGDQATHKLSEALSLALSGAENITSAVRRSKELMDKAISEASGQIENSSRLAEDRMDSIMSSARENRDGIANILSDIEIKNSKLNDVTNRLGNERIKTLEMMSLAAEALEKSAEMVVSRAQEPVDLIASSIARLSEQTDDLDSRLSVRIVELEQSQSKMRGAVEDVSTMMKISLQDTSVVTGQILAHSKQINEQLGEQKRGLSDLVDELERRSGEIAQFLEMQSQTLSDTLNISEGQISLLGQALCDKSEELFTKVSDATDGLSEMENKISSALELIAAKTNETSESIHGNVEKLTILSEQATPDCTRMIAAAEALEAKYAKLRESYVESTGTVTECLEEIGAQLDDRMEKLRLGVVDGSQSMLSMSENIGTALIDIRQASEDASESLARVQTGVTGRIDDLQLVTDQVRSKVEVLQKNLDGYIQDISQVVGRATGDLHEATELFGQSTENLDHKVDAVTRKLAEGARMYIEEGQRMSLIGEQATHKATRIVASLRDETTDLVEAVHNSLVGLQKAGESLSVRTREIDTYMQSSLRSAENYGEELRQQASQIANSSMEVVDQIADATSRLSARVNEVRVAGNSVSESIELSRQKLSDESARMTTVTRKAIEAADEATTVFSRNSAQLFRSVQEIAEQARKLKDTQVRSEREAFLSASKFVIESLYSLAVDVSRHLEDDIDTRVLRAYQRGDVAAFTRHLVEAAHKIPIDRSQRKFIEDSEFRTYTLRFIRQYEEVVEQAQNNDYGELLASLFNTSDVGKLYKILCDIAGRTPKAM